MGSSIVLKTPISCKFNDCLLTHAGSESDAGEWTIDEDTVNFIIEYHLKQCAKDGSNFSKALYLRVSMNSFSLNLELRRFQINGSSKMSITCE